MSEKVQESSGFNLLKKDKVWSRLKFFIYLLVFLMIILILILILIFILNYTILKKIQTMVIPLNL